MVQREQLEPGSAREGGRASADDVSRVDGYLQGETSVFAEIDLWVRTEMRHRYPGLAGEHEDLCQVVHTKLLRNLRDGRYEGRSALRTYVTGIVHHTAIDRIREIRRQRELLASFAREQAAEPDPPAPREKPDYELLHRAVATLPASCRELWRMVFVDKLSYEEIAERKTIPQGTVKSRMWHCRRKAMAALARLRRKRGEP